jgi:protein TonB
VPAPILSRADKPSRWSYFGAILVSAIGHAAFFFLILVVLPGFFASKPPPPSYTVKIVDSLPAGDLGTHLPRLSGEQTQAQRRPTPPKRVPPQPPKEEPTPPPPSDNDRNAIALNTKHSSTPTPKRTPTPTPTPPPPPEPTMSATPSPKPRRPEHHRATPVPTATPHAREKPRPVPTTEMAEATPKPAPNVKQQLAKLHAKLMAEHLRQMKEEGSAAHEHGGPVLASRETEGSGYGVGPRHGSAGILQSPEFLLYLQDLQKKIKDAWNFAGNDPKLTATVTVGINSDGSLNEIRVTDSSRNPAFDDSVVRAIKLAAPFPAPPEKYRSEFASGYPVIFNLGALKGDEG